MFSGTSDVCTTVKFVCRMSIGKKARDISVRTCFLMLLSLLYWQTSPSYGPVLWPLSLELGK